MIAAAFAATLIALLSLIRIYFKHQHLSLMTLPRTHAGLMTKQRLRKVDLTAFLLNKSLAKSAQNTNTDFMAHVDMRNIQTRLFTTSADPILTPCAPDSTLPKNFIPLPSNTESIQTIRFERIQGIEDNNFKDCKNLQTIYTDEDLRRIGKHTFANCPKLHIVSLHKGLTHIDDHAFANCLALTEIHIPSTVVTIGDGAFANCSNLQKVYVPDSKHAPNLQISSTAFKGCTNLQQEIQYTYEKAMCTIC